MADISHRKFYALIADRQARPTYPPSFEDAQPPVSQGPSGVGPGTVNRLSKFLNSSTIGDSQLFDDGTNVGVGTVSPNELLEVAGNIHVSGGDRTIFNRSNNALSIGTNNTERIRITNTGNVGIGTTSPSAKLTVTADSLINELTIGRGSGNIDTNTAVGRTVLFNNTTGVNNTAVGRSALFSNTTGFNNTALGLNALFNNTTGYQNTVLGVNALYSNTTGYLNTAVGRDAGRYITGGEDNATGTNSVFLGDETRPAADGQTNQIVIGYDAIGNGSNSVTLGNTSITKTVLRGNVGINIVSPSNTLDVNGTARIRTIDNGSGDIITTDSNGVLGKRTPSQLLGDIGGAPISASTFYIQNQFSSAQSSSEAWLSGRFQAGNLRIDTNTISSQNTNGNILINPNGTGRVGIGNTTPGSKLEVAGNVAIGYTTAAPTNGLIVDGDVGIGTSSPDFALDVNEPGRFRSRASDSRVLFLKQHGADTGNIIQFTDENDVNTWEIVGRSNEFYIYNNVTSTTSFYINPTSNNVGIGTDNPLSKLEVIGNVSIGFSADVAVVGPTNGLIVNGIVGIGINNPATSAILDLTSTTRALVITRMTTTQRDAIIAPINGMILYNTTLNKFQGYENGSWADLI
jgi:hypothetical protein